MTPTEISERLQRIQYLFSAGVITNVDMVFLDEETAENYKETLHLEDADGNITMVTSVTLSNGKVTLHHSGE